MGSLHDLGIHLHGVLLIIRVAGRRQSSVRVSSQRSSKKKNKGFRFMHFIMNPPPGLLNAKCPPFCLSEQSAPCHFLIGMFGEEHMSVLKEIVLVLF